jgi:hypothetical protein
MSNHVLHEVIGTAQPEVIAPVLETWLLHEVQESGTGRNRYIDAFESTGQALSEPFSGNRGYCAVKQTNHYNRYREKAKAYPEAYTDEFYTGTLIHHALMLTSGAFRVQCFMQAKDTDEYRQLRFNGQRATGVAMKPTIERALGGLPAELDASNLVASMQAHLLRTNDRIQAQHMLAYGHKRPPRGRFSPESEPVQAMLAAQRLSIGLACANIVVAASVRGGSLASVPFLEAKSISDVSSQPYYPFAA